MKHIEVILNKENNVTLKAYLHDTSAEYSGITKRPSVVVLPGGGYSMCSDREADAPAFSYLNAGFNAFILRYTTKDKKGWPAPLEDYEQAMEYIIGKSEEWNIDTQRIAVCGFSAGGHLAACAATVAKHKPTAAILGYAALKKELVQFIAPGAPNPVEQVSYETCPCFLFATRTDNIVDISNSLEFESQLTKHGIAFESHIYGCGSHGFTTGCMEMNGCDLTPRAKNWVADSIGWLEECWGKLLANGYSKPLFDVRMNENGGQNLSIKCTYSYLQQFENAKSVLADFERILDVLPSAIKNIIGNARVIDLMNVLGMSEEDKSRIDADLNKIVNKKQI